MPTDTSKDLCACGSNLPFRRCHGSVVYGRDGTSGGDADPRTTEQRVSLTGFPGTHQTLHMLYRFKGNDPRNDLPLGGSPGLYQVTFILHRPGYKPQSEYQLSFSSGLPGDSHLAICKPAYLPPGNPEASQILLFGNTEDGSFEFAGIPNARGFLGKLVTKPFNASDRDHAETIAFRALAPLLSNISLLIDIPMEVGIRETKELALGSVSISFTSPPLDTPLVISSVSALSSEYRAFSALYREASNTDTPVYRFLCLYKIVEALRARRTKLAREAKRKKLNYTAPVELLPLTNADVHNWLKAIYAVRPELDLSALDSAVPEDLRGRSASEVIEEVLSPLRNKVAHALFSDSGELPLASDDLKHTHAITRYLFFVKCLVRTMLKNDFPTELGILPR